jgi:N-acyl-D-amino-acid deacylase
MPSSPHRAFIVVIGLLIASALAHMQAPAVWVVTGARVADGNGGPPRIANVHVRGETIVAVDDVAPGPGEVVVAGTGLVLAPGFIDIHNHSTDGLATDRDAASQLAQGITSVVVGQDGSSPASIVEYLGARRAAPASLNVATMVGHATVRRAVMGDDYRRAATSDEIARMAARVDEAMRAGALGLSSGLEYVVGSYASTDEVVALAAVAGRRGGIYITHLRDEADRTMEAVAEAIEIGRRGRVAVQITHIKLGTVDVWGRARDVVALVEAARREGVDVTADAYPYLAWQSNLKVLVPDRQYTNPASVAEALADVGGGRNVQFTRLPRYPQHVGTRLDEAARLEGLSEVDFFIRIAEDEVGIIGHTLWEPDLCVFYQQPWVMVASDGGIGMAHPRGAGTFPRVLGRMVRERGWLSLGDAVRKMTAMPADRLGLTDRGRIAAGARADLVLFDAELVADTATFELPHEVPQGVRRVWVNGTLAWRDGAATGAHPGVVLGRP